MKKTLHRFFSNLHVLSAVNTADIFWEQPITLAGYRKAGNWNHGFSLSTSGRGDTTIKAIYIRILNCAENVNIPI
jgi:hypothetical protein